VPTLSLPVVVGAWTASLVELSDGTAPVGMATVELDDAVVIRWPDGLTTTTTIADVRSVSQADRQSDRVQ
jgi:hypothetical protein